MLVRILSQNLQYGGITDSSGAQNDRWDALAHLIRDSGADIALLQEVFGWAEHNGQQTARAERDTGMRVPWGALVPGQSTTLMYDPEVLRLAQWEDRYRIAAPHGFSGVGVFTLPDREVPLAVGSAHLAPDSTVAAAERVTRLAWRLRRFGDIGILGGDINHFPTAHRLDPAPPDPETLPATNMMGRWTGPPGNLRPDRSIGELLARGRYTDVAHHVADQRADTTLLAPTAPGGVRVDQLHVTEPLVPAVADYRVVTHDGSDHAALILEIDTTRIDRSRVVAPNR